MKLKTLTAALLTLVATSTFAGPTFYGEIDANIDYLPEKMPIAVITVWWKLVPTVRLLD